jgi:hypothetical protein
MPKSLTSTSTPYFNNLLSFTAILVGLVIGVGYPLFTPWRGIDYDVFLSAAQGDTAGWFYGQWALVFITPYAALPYNIAWAIFSLLNVVGIAYATYIFKGSQVLAMTCYAFTINVWYGQINGIYAGLIALMVVLLQREHVVAASIACFFAISKWHIGLPLCAGVLYCFTDDDEKRLKVITIVAGLLIAFTIIRPLWLYEILFQAGTPQAAQQPILWAIAGPFLWLLWIPVIYSKSWRFFVATWVLTAPYLHVHSLVIFAALPLGLSGVWLWLPHFLEPSQAQWIILAPATIYAIELEKMTRRDKAYDKDSMNQKRLLSSAHILNNYFRVDKRFPALYKFLVRWGYVETSRNA